MPSSLRVSAQYIEYVKKALVRNGFARQQDLAESLGISRDTVSRFFNGKFVSYLNFIEICRNLNIDLERVSNLEGDTSNGEVLASLKEQHLLQNLPHQDYIKFVGRSQELQALFRYISPDYRLHITTIEGIGGVGKTSLAMEAAYQCKKARQGRIENEKIPIFDAIIFTRPLAIFVS